MTERVVFHDGAARFVYSDGLAALAGDLGDTVVVTRASHVEPWIGPGTSAGVQWGSDMSPVGGPLLGPFDTRAAALAAERDWLRAHRGL